MLRDKFLRAMARFACKYNKLVIFVAVVLTISALVPMLRTGYTTAFNVTRMLPQDIPASRAFTKAITDFGTADEAIVVFHLNQENPRSIEMAGKLAEKIAERLKKHEDVKSAFAKLLTKEEKDQLLNVELPRHGMLLLPSEDIEAIKNKLQTKEIDKSVASTARKLMSDTLSEDMQEKVIINALGLGGIFKESFEKVFQKTAGEKNTVDTKGFLVSPKGEMLLLIVEPKYAAQSIVFSKRIMTFVEETVYNSMFGAKRIELNEFSPELIKNIHTIATTKPSSNIAKFYNLLLPDVHKAVDDFLAGKETEQNKEYFLIELNKLLRTNEGINALLGNEKEQLKAINAKADKIAAFGYDRNFIFHSLSYKVERDLLADISNNTLSKEQGESLPIGALKAFKMELAGGYQLARQYGRKLNGVMIGTLAFSGICVLLFFGYCFKRYGVLLYIGVPLVMIVCWTAGIGWALFGQLNLVSCAFAAVLVGLGIDYAVHIYNRYIEERAKGATVEMSFEVSLGHTGWGVIIGMATTCMAFLALNATRFTQLAEFGALGGIGIFLSAPAMMLVMPAIVSWKDKGRTDAKRLLQPSEFFLPQIARLIFARRRLVLAMGIFAALISVAAILAPNSISFDPGMAALRPKDRAFEVNGEIAKAFATRNPNKLTFMVIGDTEEDALENMSKYEEKLAKLKEQGLIIGYESITQYLPSPKEQRKRLKKIGEVDFAAATKDFKNALKKQEMSEEYFNFNFKLLSSHAALVENDNIILPADFQNSKISRLVNRYIARRQKEYFIDVNDFPKKYPITLARAATQFEDNLLRAPAGSVLTEEQVMALNPPEQHPSKRVKSLTVYEGGYAVKATIFPVLPKNSRDGEPIITKEWLAQVGKTLGLAQSQFEAKPNLTDFPATLTGVSVASTILADIVQEDFFNISLWIAGICLFAVNLFYHRHPIRAAICALPLIALIFFYNTAAQSLPMASTHMLYYFIGTVALFIIGDLIHKRLLRTALCFVPIAFGVLYMFGFMAILNIISHSLGGQDLLSLNFVNVLTIPIIIGVGVDNGIHLVNRYFESGRRVKPVVVDTGRALAITALTSIFGFGSLYIAKFQGLDSIAQLGLLSVIALSMVLIASVIFFPAVAATFAPGKRSSKK